jgi:hypothetical protein
MLALQEALEQRAQTRTDIVPVFIQSREFAELSTVQDCQAQGLPEQWVEKAARLAEDAHVVVVVDSLDVLSIAREHSLLTYFLAQIDRLLLIPNITVVAACRDFDRYYDRRIAERQWDYEQKCQPLNWESEIAPILATLSIDTSTIDFDTRELIRNPRELALFVELAKRHGSFNTITSQALAQRYLDTFVRANSALGETAMQAIEAIANVMLMSRRLSVPHQRFTASQDIFRVLCSLNVLQETRNGELTFGHQTLLDVLIISSAVRRGVTLNKFIQDLPPVPFVRPSIRSFVEYLARGERGEFRKQLRTVLTGSAAFHIRRLVAESFAEHIPDDGDWSVVCELRNNHREVFQVIYTQARRIEWHHFWFTHLVPALKDARDVEAIIAHAHRVSLWKNEDATGVLAFWTEILQLDWIDGKQIALQLTNYISKIDTENLALAAPLLEQMLGMPRQEHSFLGHAVARCVAEGYMEDIWLWRYIAGDINNKDAIRFGLDNKLHCESHEFGSSRERFLLQRMEQSSKLLDLALESVEHWSRINSAHYRNSHHSIFLSLTSYNDAHSQHDLQHKSSANILFDAIEASILNHAKKHSDWWQINRERLCFNHEGALRYFAILACTTNPEANVDLVGRTLTDKSMLESDLCFELGTLMRAAFIYLDAHTQDAVEACILTAYEDELTDGRYPDWVLKRRAELIATIPRYLRSPEAHAVLDGYERTKGALIRQPDIRSRSGWVGPPFSFEVFHRTSDDGVLSLLAHWTGYKRDFDDFYVGGEQEIGSQLSEASSRHPNRFLHLLSTYWADISEGFRDAIMNGAAKYLEHRYGNLQINGKWEPLDEPDAADLVSHILDELDRHPKHWYRNSAASNAMRASAHVIKDAQDAERLVFLAIGFASLQDENTIDRDSVDLITTGINMMSGHVAEALMILVKSLKEHSVPFPDLLPPTLRRFAGNEHPAIRALILRRLPYLQYHNPELGWDLFRLAMQDATGLWQIAEPCLYYAYHNHFAIVASLLARIQREGSGKDMETWGRISALAAMSKHIDIFALISDLNAMENTDAWRGAAIVWTHSGNFKQHREQCLIGIEAGLKANVPHAAAVAKQMERLFYEYNPMLSIPIELIHLCFTVFEGDSADKHHRLFDFGKWLNGTSQSDPEHALAVTEIYFAYINRTKSYLHDHENNLTQLMTRLFAEAEEREESDHGAMLQRVVSLQDMLLSLGVDGFNDWLKAAERP